MKNFGVILAVLLMISCQQQSSENTITVSGAFALYPMVVKWAEIYKQDNPEIAFDITAGGAGKGMSDVLSGMVDLAMVSREITAVEIQKGAWFIPVAHDAVLGTVNSENPMFETIMSNGIQAKQFAAIFIEQSVTDWGQLYGEPAGYPINVYTRADSCGAAETWGKYMGYSQDTINGIGVNSDPGLCETVRSDPYGIGYNNVNYLYDQSDHQPIDGIYPIPIDINENGIIDDQERFYDTLDAIIDAVSKGNYPSPPARDLYLVCLNAPTNQVLIQFLYWTLTDGQEFLLENGYVPLPKAKIEESLEKFNPEI